MVESKWSNTILPVKTMPTDNAGEPTRGSHPKSVKEDAA